MGTLVAPVKATESWFRNTLLPYLNGTLEDRLDATVQAADAAQRTANAKYFKPGAGIPQTDLAASVQGTLNKVGLFNLVRVEWLGDPAVVRPTDDPNVVCMWVKRNPAHSDPPTSSTHMLVNVDILLRAV